MSVGTIMQMSLVQEIMRCGPQSPLILELAKCFKPRVQPCAESIAAMCLGGCPNIDCYVDYVIRNLALSRFLWVLAKYFQKVDNPVGCPPIQEVVLNEPYYMCKLVGSLELCGIGSALIEVLSLHFEPISPYLYYSCVPCWTGPTGPTGPTGFTGPTGQTHMPG
jgi:hypothetical protein